MKKTTEPVHIGWREWVELPDWGLTLKAKIDTGAKSSSLDVTRITHLDDQRIQFDIHQYRKKIKVVTVEATIYKVTRVRSSNGQMQERFVVQTPMILGGVKKDILITLTSRRKMLHRMLLGREALQNDFLIDAGVDHLATSVKTR
jgi:ribosomal protein S6--L-glutamate ligase